MVDRFPLRSASAGVIGLYVLATALLVALGPLRAKANHLVDNMVDSFGSVVDNTMMFMPRIAVDCAFGAGSSLLPRLPRDCEYERESPLPAPQQIPFVDENFDTTDRPIGAFTGQTQLHVQAASKRSVLNDAR